MNRKRISFVTGLLGALLLLAGTGAAKHSVTLLQDGNICNCNSDGCTRCRPYLRPCA